MSWLYLPEQVVGSMLLSTCSDSGQSATSKTRIAPLVSSKPESEMVFSTMLPSGTTLKHSTGDPGVDAWISSLLASRASRSRSGVRSLEKMTLETAGLVPFALLEKSGPRGFFWRTPQISFSTRENENANLISSESLRSWPAWGMWDAMAVYPQAVLDSTTNGDGCGLLPTPLTRDGASFYVCTHQTALRIMNKSGSHSRQLHWSQLGTVFHDLKKGWANPRFSELMMGWPIGSTDLQPLERGRFQQWLRQHGDY